MPFEPKKKIPVQDVVLLLDPSQPSWSISSKALNMILNRFCINEEMAIESSGVYLSKYLTEARKKQVNEGTENAITFLLNVLLDISEKRFFILLQS